MKASKTPEEHVALTYWFCKNAVSSDSPLPEVEAYMGALRDVIGLILLTYYANGLLSAKITAFLSIYEEALAKRRLVF
ncbi:MAG: hypothetical protein LBH53_00420 [Puniceicoccales bacterium]|nr:hypothetical protein [Puniceicoccales bacterium]